MFYGKGGGEREDNYERFGKGCLEVGGEVFSLLYAGVQLGQGSLQQLLKTKRYAIGAQLNISG